MRTFKKADTEGSGRGKVIVLGGGIAGLTAAHELVERGFAVEVYEKNLIFGGKARSFNNLGSGIDGRLDLPGEHGFRFFPGFYKHVPDTMRRIPYRDNQNGVYDNLVLATACDLAQEGKEPTQFPVRFPESFRDLCRIVRLLWKGGTDLGLQPGELVFFAKKMWRFLTSCEERRLEEFEEVPWWTFIEAASKSEAYQKLLAIGLTRSLVAMKAKVASTRTIGTILGQFFLDTLGRAPSADRVLDGPTNEVWIDPWVQHLRSKGVVLHTDSAVERLVVEGDRISGVQLKINGKIEIPKADYYVAALPVEVMARLVKNSKGLENDPALAHLCCLEVEWMNGIQFYLKRDVKLVHGHTIYLDSPWALTSISQRQFWERGDRISHYGDGMVRGILSVDISDWDQPGGKEVTFQPAKKCNAKEIAKEVWEQLKSHLIYTREDELFDDDRIDWFLDPAILFPGTEIEFEDEDLQKRIRGLRGRCSVGELLECCCVKTEEASDLSVLHHLHPKLQNVEPLLINTIKSLRWRPKAETRFANLVLASDYVRTHTDLATMEGANEAARRAVNVILSRSGSKSRTCDVWPLKEPWLLWPFKAIDGWFYRASKSQAADPGN
jgi:uncharacterized protein with NAD-binding domain and iron-sulfur cluster